MILNFPLKQAMKHGLQHKVIELTAMIQALHGMAATAWVGGIFFAFMALRPAASRVLEPSLRLPLWQSAYSHFFPWVWLFIAVLLVTGYVDLFSRFGGFSTDALYLVLMHGIGVLMVVLFGYLYFGLYRKLTDSIESGDTPVASKVMGRMRPVMAINLSLGMLITAIGIAGPLL